MSNRRTPHRPSALSLTLLALLAATAAQGQDLITDRPDFTESAVVVPRGSTQVEGGFTRTDVVDGLQALSGPELLVRWGLTERVELRFGLPDFVDPSRGSSGLSDGSFGAKWQLGPTAGGWDVGLIGRLTVPLGDDAFTSDSVDPDVIFTLGRDLSSGWSLGTQLGVGLASAGDSERTVVAGTLVLGRGVSNRLSLFVELAAEDVEGETTGLLAHHGYTFLARQNLQFDVHFGVGLTDGAPDSLIGAGVSWRR